jgi:hypothetical protein
MGLFFAGLAVWLQYQKYHALYHFEDDERFADECTAISLAVGLLCFALSYFAWAR